MSYFGNSVNSQPILTETAGADISAGAGKAVKYDSDGAVVLAGVGESICGVLIMQTDEDVHVGDLVTVQFKDVAYVRLSGSCAKGDILAVGTDGKFVKSVSGVARALEFGKDGWLVPAHITLASGSGAGGSGGGVSNVIVDSKTGKSYMITIEDEKVILKEV